ncbi:MAG: hypothetical protein IT377_06345 [Polyangiaceae bacterium]|nr:hypothetical protein [Polyangiaceae bacterium]
MRAMIGLLALAGCAAPAPEVARPATGGATTPSPAASADSPGAAPIEAAPTAAAEPSTDASAEPAAPADPQPPTVATAPAPEPSADPRARDPRRIVKQQRPRSLLVPELAALERLYAATRKSSPDRPMVMRRLAEGYVELEYAAAHEPDGAKIAAAARKHALTYYLALRSEYPTYAKLDEVLYYAGYEHERGGDSANARALYRELVQQSPTSPFVLRVPAKWRSR